MAGFNFNLDGEAPKVPSETEIKQEVAIQVTSSDDEKTKMLDAATAQVAQLMRSDLDDVSNRRAYVTTIETFGSEEIKVSNAKNEFLRTRLVDYQATSSESGEIAHGLANLTLKMKDLDPGGLDFTKSTGLFGRIANPVRKYFEKYRTADAEIADIVKSLNNGKKMLQNDNVTLELEQASLRDATKKLAKDIDMGLALDSQLSAAVERERASGGDEEKIRFVEEELLFPLRQRIEDFQQLLAVDQQGVVAMEIIRRNNRELIRSVDRASTVSVSALRVAVTVANALYNQKIVLEQVNAVNEATNSMISSTAKMLGEQGVAIQKQASEAAISPDTLRQAFSDTLKALDNISNYRREALPQMRAAVDEFKALAEEGERNIARMEKASLGEN